MSAPRDPNRDLNLRAAYDQLCISYHAIDDFRTKLLSFLPLVTGTGILALFNALPGTNSAVSPLASTIKAFLEPAGAFGLVITLGLFVYELHGIRKCHDLIVAGQLMEHELDIVGQFVRRRPAVAGMLNEPFAAGVIYPAVIATWAYATLLSTDPATAGTVAVSIFLGGWALMVGYGLWLRYFDGQRITTLLHWPLDGVHPPKPEQENKSAY